MPSASEADAVRQPSQLPTANFVLVHQSRAASIGREQFFYLARLHIAASSARMAMLQRQRHNCCRRGSGAWPAPCAVQLKKLQLHERLGDGASGVTYRATMRAGTSDACECSVAVKVFKRGSVSSDGYPLSEVAACTLAASHSCIIPALHSVADAPDAAPALVMPLIGSVFTTLAAPPSMSTCTRDVYAPSTLS